MSQITVITPEYLGDTLKIESDEVQVNIDNDTITKDGQGILIAKPSSSKIKGILGEDISGGMLVCVVSGLYFKFNASNTVLYDRLIGIANQTGASGAEIDIVTEGMCDQVSGLTAGLVYYAGDNGSLVSTAPYTGLRISVGSAIASDKFNLKIKDSIIKIV